MERVGLLNSVAAATGLVICIWLVLRVGAARVRWTKAADRLFTVRN